MQTEHRRVRRVLRKRSSVTMLRAVAMFNIMNEMSGNISFSFSHNFFIETVISAQNGRF